MEDFPKPYIDRIKNLPEKHKDTHQAWHEYSVQLVEKIGGKTIDNLELHKTERDIQILNFTNDAANELLKKYGREKIINIPLSNIHILEEDAVSKYTNGELSKGGHSTLLRSIIIEKGNSDLQFSIILFHELMHLKSYTALQVISSEKHNELRPYRSGISVVGKDGSTQYLMDIEEAVVGLLTSEFYNEILKTKPALFLEDINKINAGSLAIDISRSDEVRKLNEIIETIYEKNETSFISPNDIQLLFKDAHINGNLLKIARLVETTYGAGSFRTLANNEDIKP